jgi:hypothetical protein
MNQATTAERRLHWKLARAEYERLMREVRIGQNNSMRWKVVARGGLLQAADDALHRALEEACE